MPPLIEARQIIRSFGAPPGPVDRLLQRFGGPSRPTLVQAVRGVTFAVAPGEVVGLVGESGCGKSTLGRIVADLGDPSDGRIFLDGTDRASLTAADRHRWGLAVQMVFQDPMASLNPRLRVETIIGEAAVLHGFCDRRERRDYVAGLLTSVGLAASDGRRYPHEFSGGQRQRIGIARALAVKPRMLVCDEPVSALDVSVQAQVINLFMALRAARGLTYLLISHDLAVVRHVSDRVLVMYLGQVVEEGPTEAVLGRPNHPYTQALLSNLNDAGGGRRNYAPLPGEPPSPLAPPPGCAFSPRCPHAMARCRTEAPVLRPVGQAHRASCHLSEGS